MFAPLCYPPAGSEAIVTSKLVIAMLDAGWQIDVITQTDFGQFYPSNREKLWEPILSVIHSIEGIGEGGFIETITRSSPFSFLSALRPFFWACKAAMKGWRLMRQKSYDCVLSRAAPQYGHLPALMISCLFDIPWVANWSDPMPPRKAPPPYGQGKTAKLPYHIQLYYRVIAARASHHTFPCERLRKYCSEYIPGIESKSSVIPHIALTKLSVSAADPREFTLCHAGSLAYRDTRVFFEGVKSFIRQTPAAEGIMIKFIGPNSDVFLQNIDEFDLNKNVEIHKVKTYRETLTELSKSAVLVIIEAQCSEGIFFPSKFTDYVQAGRTILALSPVEGTLNDFISRCGGGIAADNTDAHKVAETLGAIFQLWHQGTLQESYSNSKLYELFGEKAILNKHMQMLIELTY